MPIQDKTSSQQLVAIENVRDGIILLKNGGLRAVLSAEGVNFELKSSEEQKGIIDSFQEFLTSLDFSLQIIMHSEKIDLSNYLAVIKKRQEQETNELLKMQTADYLNFIDSFAREYNIMTKRFFVVVPYDPTAMQQSVLPGIKNIFTLPSEATVSNEAESEFLRNKSQLETRVNLISNGLDRMGITNQALGTEKLVELLYKLYNPQETYR